MSLSCFRIAVLSLCLNLPLLSTLPAEAQTTQITATMVKNPYLIKVPFKPYGSMLYAIMIKEINGKVAVCGMWAVGDRWQAYVKKARLPQRVRGVTTVTVANVPVLKGVGFFTRASEEGFVSGATVNCQLTNTDWQSGLSSENIGVRIPRLRVVA